MKDVNSVIALSGRLFAELPQPTPDDGRIRLRKVLPHGALLDKERITSDLRVFAEVEVDLCSLFDKTGEWKVELRYTEGREDDSPFGSKSPDCISLRIDRQ